MVGMGGSCGCKAMYLGLGACPPKKILSLLRVVSSILRQFPGPSSCRVKDRFLTKSLSCPDENDMLYIVVAKYVRDSDSMMWCV